MRKFLVVLDDSKEFLNALYYTARRAEKTGAGIVILAVIPPEETHFLGVGDAMREEAQHRVEEHFKVFEKWTEGKVSIIPELRIRHGRPAEEILKEIKEDPEIAILILGASAERRGPGPLISELIGKKGGQSPIPISIVPGLMSRKDIEAIS